MTIVIGLKTADGVILAADCQGTGEGEKWHRNKISIGLFEDEENPGREPSGAYFGTAGYYYFADCVPSFLSKRANMADLLTSEEVLKTTRDNFNFRIDAIEAKLEARWSLGLKANEVDNLYDERDRLYDLIEARCFIENTEKSSLFSLSRIVARLSENYAPDLLLFSDGFASSIVRWHSIGSGSKYSIPILEKHYEKGLSSNEGLNLVAEAINAALANEEDFKGYSLVSITRNDGKLIVRTACDFCANQLDLSNIKWAVDEHFHYKIR
jgi:hypothetical protein